MSTTYSEGLKCHYQYEPTISKTHLIIELNDNAKLSEDVRSLIEKLAHGDYALNSREERLFERIVESIPKQEVDQSITAKPLLQHQNIIVKIIPTRNIGTSHEMKSVEKPTPTLQTGANLNFGPRLDHSTEHKQHDIIVESIPDSQKIVYILSLNSDGARGVIGAVYLRKIEQIMSRYLRTQDLDYGEDFKDVALYRCFDIIAGTGTGALLAAGLSYPSAEDKNRSCMSLSNLIETYISKGAMIFRPSTSSGWFNSKHKLDEIRSVLQEKLSETRLSQSLTQFLAVSLDSNGHPAIFDSRKAVQGTDIDRHVKDVCYTSVAAPMYPQSLHERSSTGTNLKRPYFDSGIVSDDLTMIAIEKARERYPRAKEYRVISIGTGYNLEKEDLNYLQSKEKLSASAQITTVTIQASMNLTDYLLKMGCDNVIVMKLDLRLSDVLCEMDNAHNIEKLKLLTEEDCSRIEKQLEDMAVKFLDPYRSSYQAMYFRALSLSRTNGIKDYTAILGNLWNAYCYDYPAAALKIAEYCMNGYFPIVRIGNLINCTGPLVIGNGTELSFESNPYPIWYRSPSFWYFRTYLLGTDYKLLDKILTSTSLSDFQHDPFALYFTALVIGGDFLRWDRGAPPGQAQHNMDLCIQTGIDLCTRCITYFEQIVLDNKLVSLQQILESGEFKVQRLAAANCYNLRGLFLWHKLDPGVISDLKRSMDLGSESGRHSLAITYYFSYKPDGIEIPNREAALQLFELGGENGYAPSGYVAGLIYDNQKSIDSESKALEWYSKSAKFKYSLAEFALAQIYCRKYIRTQNIDNYNHMVEYTRRAALHGHNAARNIISKPTWCETSAIEKSGKINMEDRRKQIAIEVRDTHRQDLVAFMTQIEEGIGSHIMSPRTYVRKFV